MNIPHAHPPHLANIPVEGSHMHSPGTHRLPASTDCRVSFDPKLNLDIIKIEFDQLFFRSGYMVYHMVIRRDTAPVKVMKHDVRQFKSLEGYLESGPQFVLQSYILLKGLKSIKKK